MAYSKASNSVDNLVLNRVLRELDNSEFFGTMSSLRTRIVRICSKNQRTTLPQSPAALRVVLNRIANRLRSRGVSVSFGRTATTRFATLVK